ncbi:hypothetical protein IW261DRAFT_1421628 [Armillaria novae-zelandiae]|uniref:Mug135-like C-terminal domain-containing protein n=1 Tax=Armillaria novae-zelandiae TaxID=153914 RepID=A0AA39P2F1_9AGAR|nr:hypothetical protein IW261DRAFT_1421628 [Armillaria novae-zelandiae]
MAYPTFLASNSHLSLAPYPNHNDYQGFPRYAEGTDHGPDGSGYSLGVPIYEHRLVNANPYRPLYETRVTDPHQDTLDLIERHKAKVFASIASLTHAVHRQTNYYRFSGEGIPFEIIPFSNGSMPNKLPHLLPALTSVHVVNALTPEQLVRYCSGYRIVHDPENIELMIVDLKAYIGCAP